jgi:hypothetical protein
MIVTPTEISGEDRPESDMRRPQRVGSPAARLGDPSAALGRKLVQASVFDANASAPASARAATRLRVPMSRRINLMNFDLEVKAIPGYGKAIQ